MEKVIKYINENLDKNLTLTAISKYAGYSTWHFSTKFKNKMGITFLEYLRNRRMQLACHELIKGRKITDIALEFGYETPSGFDKAFLKEFGCTPTGYKNIELFYNNKYGEMKDMRYKITDRCSIIKERVVDNNVDSQKYMGQKLYNYIKGYYNLPNEKRNNYLLPASSLVAVIKNFKPYISDGELIVGYNYSDGAFPSDLEEYVQMLIQSKNNNKEDWTKYIENSNLKSNEKEELTKMIFDTSDPFLYPYNESKNNIILDDSELSLINEYAARGSCGTHNHSILSYESVLKYGFSGLLDKIKSSRNEKENLSKDELLFYESLEMVCEASCNIGEKYAKLADEMQIEYEGERKEELLAIKKVCERVPKYRARNFMEAIQSLWFAHIINTWEDGINANSLGRLDQILFPYYKKDIDLGILTKEKAFELICLLWLKLYRDYDVQQSTIGGCLKNGLDGVNELSYLMLDATEALDFVRCLSVRFSSNTPKAFMKRALEVVGHVQKGVPFFFCDDVMIESLTLRDIKIKDARDYGVIGCVETCIPGKSNPHAVSGRLNVLKAIEYALNNGKSMINSENNPGVKTGELNSLLTFNALKDAVYKQIKRMVDLVCKLTNSSILVAAKNFPLAYKSLLTEGCIKKGLDFSAGGPIYNYYQIMILGIPNLADSLAAIEKLVFIEKKYTLEELVFQLKNNYPDEAIRLEFINNAPKYGNDFPEVDKLAYEIMEYTCKYIQMIPSVIGEGFHPQPFTFLWMVEHGKLTAATPDGRRSGDILAYSVSPMQGRDFNGITALLNSLSNLPTKLAPGTTSAIVEVDPYLFTDKNLDYFVDLLMVAGKKGLSNIQFNVIDKETLIDARKNPEKHKNLAVRVSGFSQKFILLDENMQEHIINRTKHKIL